MTYGAFSSRDFAAVSREEQAQSFLSQTILGGIGLALAVAAALWILFGPSAAAPPPDAPRVEASKVLPRAEPRSMEASRASRSAPRALSLRDPTLLDPAYTAGLAPMTFAQTILRPSGLTPSPNPLVTASLAPAPAPAPEPPLVQAQAALSDAARDPLPLPPARPAASPLAAETMPPLTGRRRMAQEASKPAALVRPADPRSVFDRMFGATPRPDAALAYAAPEEGSLGLFGAARGGGDRWTAVYDIAAHTVTLPDGTRLEAHSGLGAWLDDPRGVTEHMRGATPPNLYELEPREQLFHGVRALRLNPVGGTTYGRVGLLAHTFMLGPRGDSNGCVVFRDYKTFRQAYDNGQVRRLKVVARGG